MRMPHALVDGTGQSGAARYLSGRRSRAILVAVRLGQYAASLRIASVTMVGFGMIAFSCSAL